MYKKSSVDVAIFGGGVAGLWLLDRVRKAGLSAALFESGALGGGQTNKAQGIIHGGMKYALQGVLTRDAEAMADVPTVWRDCLIGKGEMDLSGVPILSEAQHLWSPGRFTSRLTGLLATATLISQVKPLDRSDYPQVFNAPDFKGQVYALDEIVLDVPALVRELAKVNQDAVFRIEPFCEQALTLDDDGGLARVMVYMAGQSLEVRAQHFIFTAGAGNDVVVKKLGLPELRMQRRPLHMTLVKTPFDLPLYAHCLGLGMRPRLTITTHRLQDGANAWYLGGVLAEEGVARDERAQADAARDELRTLFPWLDFSGATFASFMIDRAEPSQPNGLKPESCYAKQVANMTIAWPTKLALAPRLADEVMQQLQARKLMSQGQDTRELRAWPMPPVAQPVWDDLCFS